MEEVNPWINWVDVMFPKLKVKGRLCQHRIRKPTKPMISTIDTLQLPHLSYEIIHEPNEASPDYLIVHVPVPDKVRFLCSPCKTTLKNAKLVIEKRWIILSIPDYETLKIQSSVDLDTLEGGAQFDKRQRLLTMTLTVLKS